MYVAQCTKRPLSEGVLIMRLRLNSICLKGAECRIQSERMCASVGRTRTEFEDGRQFLGTGVYGAR